MATPIGILGGIRGTFFFNFGTASFNGEPFQAWTTQPGLVRPVAAFGATSEEATPRQINIVLNWHQELLERVPVP